MENHTFQHNDRLVINRNTLRFVMGVKSVLLKRVADLFEMLDIRYVIAHGNLLEQYRDAFIYRDDDIDIRMEINDIDKWERFCSDPSNQTINGLVFDDRFTDMKSQKFNGIQCRLESLESSHIDIHVDLVFNKVTDRFWVDYDIDYSSVRKVRYFGVSTYVPSLYDTTRMLLKDYGPNFIKPDVPWRGPTVLPKHITPSS